MIRPGEKSRCCSKPNKGLDIQINEKRFPTQTQSIERKGVRVEQKTAFLACQFHGIYSGLTWHLFEQWQNNLGKKDTLQMRPIQLDLVFPRADFSPSSLSLAGFAKGKKDFA